MGKITYRRLGPEDADLVDAIPEGLFDNPIDPAQTRAFLADGNSILWLAFDGDLAVSMATGSVLLHPDKAPQLFINEVGTRDSHQRRGIATALCRHLLDEGHARGCAYVWLGTETDNTAARALYRKLGGHETEGLVMYDWDDEP